MGRSVGKMRTQGLPNMPVVPTENVGIMSGPMRKPRGGRRIDKRGSRRGGIFGGSSMVQASFKDPVSGRMFGGLIKDGVPQFKKPDFISAEEYKKNFPKLAEDYKKNPPKLTGTPDRRNVGIPIPPRSIGQRPLTGGYNPESGVRYTDTGVPTAVQQTRRVAVQDPTLGGAPEREVPIARERRQRITRESDPRGRAPFSPDERGMARDRFFERMFDRADEAKQQRSMEREERGNVRDALKSERGVRESEMAGPSDERQGRRQGGGGGMRRRRRRGGMMRRRRGRRRDFTRRRSQMEGGRRGRSGREMAEFRDQYVSTLR